MLLCLLAGAHLPAAGFDDAEMGWTPGTFQEAEPWKEGDSGLPAYPQKANLIRFDSKDAGGPYTIFLDAPSVAVGEDQVVRYTVVIVSDSGVWNVSYEGLHCGNKTYRRYAYGVDGAWQQLADSPWLPLDSRGLFAYRHNFYLDYMCNPSGAYLQPEQIISKFRSRKVLIGD